MSWKDKSKRAKKGRKKRAMPDRLAILALAVILLALTIVFRLFLLQVMSYGFYSVLASNQREIETKLFPKRGDILVSSRGSDELFPLATNKEYYLVYAQPNLISDPQYVGDKLSEIFAFDDEEKAKLMEKLNKNDDPYEPIMQKVEEQTVNKIKELNLEGIKSLAKTFRYYPENNMASHVLGFVSMADDREEGQYGIEGYFDGELRGQMGKLQIEKDVGGAFIPIGQKNFQPALDGDNIILTIDRAVEYEVCKYLKKAVSNYKAESGSIVIMDPASGAIIAMCGYPDFDPNNYSQVDDISYFNNEAIFAPYEPGSIFKPITMSMGLDLGLISPETTYEDEGELKIGDYTIRNFDGKRHGTQTMIEVLNQSLNLGAIFVADLVGQERFRSYVHAFGFGQLTGVQLETESPGDVSSLDKPGYIYMATSSYGQGITVTPIQMVAAFSAIANGGNLYKPYIVDKIIKPDGSEIITEPKVVRRVISPRAAALVSGMLVSVVNKGYDNKAKIPGYYIAGKTGTAQVPDKVRGGYSDKTNHSFIGFGPVDNPRFTMLIRLDKPAEGAFASNTTAPVFGDISKFLLKYYQVPPDYE